jgi:hypothetical protein
MHSARITPCRIVLRVAAVMAMGENKNIHIGLLDGGVWANDGKQ